VSEGFARAGIRYTASERDKSQLYLDALPLFTAGRVRLIQNDRLTHQLISLERRATRTGRDIVSHPDHRNAHDDSANAVCGALVLASVEAGPQLWHRRVIAKPTPWPHRCLLVFATAAADQSGVVVIFWAQNADRYGGPKCLLIDYMRRPLDPLLFANVLGKLELLALEVPVADAVAGGLFAPSTLAAHAESQGLPAPTPWRADAILADRETALMAAAAQLATGHVNLSSIASETALTLPNPLTAIQPGAAQTAAADAATLGICALMDRADQPPEWRKAGI